MIKGPFPLGHDKRYEVPLERPYLTPVFMGERVALRVSDVDYAKLRGDVDYAKLRGGAELCGVVTDLDSGKRYELRRSWLAWVWEFDAEIIEVKG
jgi:hypothetical protein